MHASLDLEILGASLRGYVAGLGRALTADERRGLLLGVEWVSLELAARFAADALFESYFGWDATRFPGRGEHNLVRARGQWSLHEALLATRAAARGDAGHARGAVRRGLMGEGAESTLHRTAAFVRSHGSRRRDPSSSCCAAPATGNWCAAMSHDDGPRLVGSSHFLAADPSLLASSIYHPTTRRSGRRWAHHGRDVPTTAVTDVRTHAAVYGAERSALSMICTCMGKVMETIKLTNDYDFALALAGKLDPGRSGPSRSRRWWTPAQPR